MLAKATKSSLIGTIVSFSLDADQGEIGLLW
jgi:hypothetical protein